MVAAELTKGSDWDSRIEWRLYHNMLVTRLLEEALMRWEHEGKIAAQTFPSRGQEAIAIGCCLALEKGDAVIPSFRTRGAMIGMGVSIAAQLREFVHSPMAAGDSRDAPHHSSWPELGVMPGSTMIGGHLAMGAGLALAMQFASKQRERDFFGDGTPGRGFGRNHAHRRRLGLPLISACENNGLEMSTPWPQRAKPVRLFPTPNRLDAAVRWTQRALDLYHRRAWRVPTRLSGSRVFGLLTFRTGLIARTSAKCVPASRRIRLNRRDTIL